MRSEYAPTKVTRSPNERTDIREKRVETAGVMSPNKTLMSRSGARYANRPSKQNSKPAETWKTCAITTELIATKTITLGSFAPFARNFPKVVRITFLAVSIGPTVATAAAQSAWDASACDWPYFGVDAGGHAKITEEPQSDSLVAFALP
jgi:hypothetical protein